MNNPTFISHKDLDEQTCAKIISLKSQHWRFDFGSQLKWMNENLDENDIHVFLENNGAILAYLNIIRLKVTVDNNVFDMYGIGNVCTDKEHLKRGLAAGLIGNTNRFIMNSSKSGLLLCHEPLLAFYGRAGWTDITYAPSAVFVAGKKYGMYIMSLNLSVDVCGKCVRINKNF